MEIAQNARVWIYQSDRSLSPSECHDLQSELDAFTQQWQAHQQQLAAKAFLKHQQFIILTVDENRAPATGCSIDTSVRFLKDLEQKYQISLLDRMRIAYLDQETVKTCDKAEFQSLITEGKITKNTIVFNNMVQNYTDFENKWQTEAAQSWHSQVFDF